MLPYKVLTFLIVTIIVSMLVLACSDPTNGSDKTENAVQQAHSKILTVYKGASCGCCGLWSKNMDINGFKTIAVNRDNLTEFKSSNGIPVKYHSCHTALSREGFVFEGHVPAKFIKKFLEEKPEGAIGLSVPGMPLGSPGMEQGEQFTPYNVVLLKADGSVSVYAEVNSLKGQY
ncbi:DUF411 domain-containing protein [Shewanella sp. Isolate7]|uniref:DUF411 domain-containing protein n=1 Tax=Shewanella sp. Isolate7 TaxID=2908528 RepID=UPI001EFDB984|nr:DUF411 domain-containing protein [Shewanella sp. Isolate7]MCG9723133.1 DUF411 domain-containing protein [Shewanella sp. Isolate7]